MRCRSFLFAELLTEEEPLTFVTLGRPEEKERTLRPVAVSGTPTTRSRRPVGLETSR